jgi:hypothetical protein
LSITMSGTIKATCGAMRVAKARKKSDTPLRNEGTESHRRRTL